jgi:hypothetical protein
MVKEALETRSSLKFDGSDVNIKSNPEDVERNEYENDRKAAVHNALNDINTELGIKNEPKKDDSKK